jgi:oxalate decarboxylase/phosphoglucose isomerase-like protein (cupin superfamily)
MSHPPIAVDPNEVDTIMASWVTAKVMCDPAVTGPAAMSAVSLFFDPGQGHARHNHPDNEQIIFVVSGEAEMMIEHVEGKPETRTIRTGSVVHIPRGAYHSTFTIGWEPVRILAIYSPPGPESSMRGSPEFKVLPAGELPVRSPG